MATKKEDDYTKYRAVGVIPYGINDKIGRHDYQKYTLCVSGTTTISGTPGTILR